MTGTEEEKLEAERLTERWLIRSLLMVHQPEEYGDCVEDGDPWPCKTARVIHLYQTHNNPRGL